MRIPVAGLLGSGLGLTLGLGVSGLTALAVTTSSWPRDAVDPADRARAVAEGISAGMYWGLIAIVVCVPFCTTAFVLHARRGGASRATDERDDRRRGPS